MDGTMTLWCEVCQEYTTHMVDGCGNIYCTSTQHNARGEGQLRERYEKNHNRPERDRGDRLAQNNKHRRGW